MKEKKVGLALLKNDSWGEIYDTINFKIDALGTERKILHNYIRNTVIRSLLTTQRFTNVPNTRTLSSCY